MPRAELELEAAGYRYLEVRCPIELIPTNQLVPDNGLIQVDTQLGYQLSLRNLPARSNQIDAVSFVTSEPPNSALHFRPFSTERYARLPTVDPLKLTERYQKWALTLIQEQPEWSFQLTSRDQILGYSFGRPTSATEVSLDLVVSAPNCDVPGLGLYLSALHAYADLGITRVRASFSVKNLAAVNIHVALGCRLTSATDIWFFDRQ
jgi:hypothetical protein